MRQGNRDELISLSVKLTETAAQLISARIFEQAAEIVSISNELIRIIEEETFVPSHGVSFAFDNSNVITNVGTSEIQVCVPSSKRKEDIVAEFVNLIAHKAQADGAPLSTIKEAVEIVEQLFSTDAIIKK